MTRLFALTLLLLAFNAPLVRGGSPREADAARPGTAPQLTVRLYDYAKPGEQIVSRAREQAERVLGEAGIALRWLRCPLTMEELASNPTCNGAAGPTDLVIRLLTPKMREEVSSKTGTFGFALIGDDPMPRTASVLYGNVERLAWERDQDSSYGAAQRSLPLERYVGILLGHVLAHEIGHLLLATNEHGRDGLMQAHWGAAATRDAVTGRLRFEVREIKRLVKRMRARMNARR